MILVSMSWCAQFEPYGAVGKVGFSVSCGDRSGLPDYIQVQMLITGVGILQGFYAAFVRSSIPSLVTRCSLLVFSVTLEGGGVMTYEMTGNMSREG